MRTRSGWLAWAGIACAVDFSPPTRAQSEDTLAELQRLHARVADPRRVVPADEAEQALELLSSWKLSRQNLAPEHLARLLETQTYIFLALGDAATAQTQLQLLQDRFPDAPGTLQVAWLVACAAGDAELGVEVARKLGQAAPGDEKPRWSQRRRWMSGVGVDAPDAEIRAEDMTEYSTARRGRSVLVIDFWNVLARPEPDESKALVALYKEYRDSDNFELVGVNADGEARVEQARKFASDAGYVWSQRYEQTSTNAPITHQAFKAGRPPWVVLVDSYSFVRAIGAASEPGFQYAVRAAVSEARGKYPPVPPRDKDGKQRGAAVAQKGDEGKSGGAQPPAKGDLPSNVEAAAKLQQARLFWKGGRKTDAKKLLEEIVRDFPNTREAKEAAEWLDDMP